MALIKPILDELAREGETTRRVLARVPTDKLSWKPHEKSRSLGDLAWHVASIPGRIAAMAQLEDADVLAHKQAPRPETAEGIVEHLTAGLAQARKLLSKLSDDDLKKKIHFHRGEITMARLPKIAFLRAVLLNHSYHHRGQLSVYLRLLDVPVPSIYGPTADES
ncbi:MAG: DinB family protein [Thermoanaerobaculia bacterium]